MPNFRECNQTQTVFRQPVPAQMLGKDHPARVVNAVVEMLDLDPIYASYKEEGEPAYHPKMMLKMLFYSYLIGILSNRKREPGLELRADYVFLSGDQVPDFHTLNTFRTRHMAQLPGLFPHIVLLCSAIRMVDADTKIMRHKDRRIFPSCNQQSAVDGSFGIIFAVASTLTRDIPRNLFTLVDAAEIKAGEATW